MRFSKARWRSLEACAPCSAAGPPAIRRGARLGAPPARAWFDSRARAAANGEARRADSEAKESDRRCRHRTEGGHRERRLCAAERANKDSERSLDAPRLVPWSALFLWRIDRRRRAAVERRERERALAPGSRVDRAAKVGGAGRPRSPTRRKKRRGRSTARQISVQKDNGDNAITTKAYLDRSQKRTPPTCVLVIVCR